MLWNRGHGVVGESKAYGVWQRIDTSSLNEIDLKATASSGDRQLDGSTVLCEYGVIRVGITSTDPAVGWIHPPNGNTITAYHTSPRNGNAAYPSPNYDETKLDLGYVEWSNGNTSEKELLNIDVSSHSYVWVYIQSYSPWTADAVTGASHTYINAQGNTVTGSLSGSSVPITPTSATNITPQKNTVQSVEVIVPGNIFSLQNANDCLLYTSPSPRDATLSRMPSSA